MSQWGTSDDPANSVIWAPAKYNQSPTRANANLMFNANSTVTNTYVTGANVTMLAVSATEMNSGNASSESPKIAHTGWVIRTVGSGGRAGRVQYEVLVAGGITGDYVSANTNVDDTYLPNA